MHPPGPGLQLHHGAYIRHPVPPGWEVVEDGAFAVVLVAPDRRAVSVLVGNAGLPLGYPPHQFVYEKVMGLQPQGLQLGPPRPGPRFGAAAAAWEFDVAYGVGGVPCVGLARCHVFPAYDTVAMIVTFVASERGQWASYAPWLPSVPMQAVATHPGAFGMQGVAQQNLASSTAMGEQLADHRRWSAATWAEVDRQRDASQRDIAFERGQALSGTQRYDNPYSNQPIDLPAQNQSYWVHPVTGQIVGDPSPSFDPRTPADSSWRRMSPRRR